MFLAIYVNDGLLIGENNQEMDSLLEELKTEFEIVTFSNPSSFLGIEINITEDKVTLSQKNYIETILRNYKLENPRPVSTPMIYNPKQEDTAITEKISIQRNSRKFIISS